MKNRASKGFTLIELLVVIAILAVLSVVVILTLNPAQLLRQSRDSGRLSDLSILRSALSLYLSTATSPNLASSSFGYSACYLSTPSGDGTTTAKCGVFATAGATTNASTSSSTLRNINSTGWIPVNLAQSSMGTPIGNLPVDPANNKSYYYAYAASSTGVYEIDAIMESSKYIFRQSSDGGDNPNAYEIGTNLSL